MKTRLPPLPESFSGQSVDRTAGVGSLKILTEELICSIGGAPPSPLADRFAVTPGSVPSGTESHTSQASFATVTLSALSPAWHRTGLPARSPRTPSTTRPDSRDRQGVQEPHHVLVQPGRLPRCERTSRSAGTRRASLLGSRQFVQQCIEVLLGQWLGHGRQTTRLLSISPRGDRPSESDRFLPSAQRSKRS